MAATSSSPHYYTLATRSERRRSEVIDGILVFSTIFLGAFAKTSEIGTESTSLFLQLMGLFLLYLVQSYFLLRDGQTIGKKIMKIRIVTAETGEHPSCVQLLLLRPLARAISILPIIGSLIEVADRFLINRTDQRCFQEFLSGTKIVHQNSN